MDYPETSYFHSISSTAKQAADTIHGTINSPQTRRHWREAEPTVLTQPRGVSIPQLTESSTRPPFIKQYQQTPLQQMGSTASPEKDQIVTIDVYFAKDLVVRSGHRYLDVRTEEEFKKGHVDVENPLNVPYMFNTPEGRVKNPKFLEQVLSLCNKDDHLVVGCQSGVRSVYATTDLLKEGFKDVSNMGGGYLAWVENGFSVKKPQVEEDTKRQEEL